jgi:hypothetical protein
MKQHHIIEVFSANCPLCKHVTDDIQIGKCDGCEQIVYNINNLTDEIKLKMRDYGITSVPSTIIDCQIKIVGIPDFPWICSEDFYGNLKKEYPLSSDGK